MTLRRLFFAMIWGIILFGASGAGAADPSSVPAESEEPEYVYNPALRDPFLPLAGGLAGRPVMVTADRDSNAGAFNPASMTLKGIIQTPKGRWAVLSSAAGERFIVENGKVLDAKRKPVVGFVGIIKKKSLVLIDRDNQVTELKLKRDQKDQQQ